MTQAEHQNPSSYQKTAPIPGHPAIEAIVSSGDLSAVDTSFKQADGRLDTVIREAKGFGKAREAKKAVHAFELTIDLLRQLIQVKSALAEKRKPETQTGTSGLKRKV